MSFSRCLVSLAAILAFTALSPGHAQLFTQVGGVAGAKQNAPPAPAGPLQTGRSRPIAADLLSGLPAIELEAGTGIDGDFARSTGSLQGNRFPVVIYAVEGKAGRSLKVSVKSADVHTMIWVTRTLMGSIGRSTLQRIDGPRDSELTVTFKQDSVHYVVISGYGPNGRGGLDYGHFASIGKFSITVTDPASDTPIRMVSASGASPLASQTGDAAPRAKGSLELTYAQLCSDPAAAGSETCQTLKSAMIAKLTGASAPKATPAKAGAAKVAGRKGGRAAGRKGTTANAADVAEVAIAAVDPVQWAAAEAAVALQPGPFAQSYTTPYGRNTQFEIKLPRQQAVEIMVDLSQGQGTTRVCHIPDALLGSAEVACPNPSTLDKGVAVWRFKQARTGEVQVKISQTKGPPGTSYRVITRPDTSGQGRAFLTRFERLAGRPYVLEGIHDGLMVKAVLDYTIVEPGRSGKLRFRDEGGQDSTQSLALDGNGDLVWTGSGQSGIVQPGGDGALYQYFSIGRIGWIIGADGSAERTWFQRLSHSDLKPTPAFTGGFVIGKGTKVTAIPPRAVAPLLAAGAQRIARAKALRMLDWGTLAQMAGRTWIYTASNGVQGLMALAWEVPGYRLVANYTTAERYGIDQPFAKLTLTHDAVSGKISGQAASGKPASVMLTPLGETVIVEDGRPTQYSIVSPDEVMSVTTAINGTGQPYQERYRAVSQLQLASIGERARQLKAQRDAQLAAQQQQQDSGGGLLGFINQATQIYQLANDPNARMAAYGQKLNELTPGLGDALTTVGSQMAANNGNGIASGVGGGLGGGALGGGGSYPARPPENLSGECPGFSKDNYKQRAFQGGNDTQLFTLCGQTFALYAQYLNAIRQGYAESDANRTYAAHSQAASVVRNFRREAR